MSRLADRSVIKLFGRWTRALFLVASITAVVVTLVSFVGFGPITPASRSMIWLLVINFVLIGILAFSVGIDYFRLRPQNSSVGQGKLARRFTTLFSLAAIVPAIFVAVFLGTSLNRSIDSWFSDRIQNIVENSASVSRSNLQTIADDIRLDMGIMAIDLNTAVVGFETEPDVFARFLQEQALFREFTSALILDSSGSILLASDPQSRRSFEPPAYDMFETADSNDVAVELSNATSQFWALYKLEDFDDAYVYTARPIHSALLESFVNSEQALSDYRVAEERSRRLEVIFMLGFVQITALILLFVVRYGVQAADEITRPIARLADAADDVRKGDLTVQVKMPKQDNEISELTASFNAMTTRLRGQRDEIDRAHDEALERTRFIEAVLQGVSAGVVRLDHDLTVTLANPSACTMFEALGSVEPVSLQIVSPEFARLAQEAIHHGEARSTTIVLNDEEGQRHFLIRAEPTSDEPPGCILTFDDTSRLIAAQRQTAWRDVARRVAHEIRNPLTPIQLSAERLRRRYRKLVDDDDTVFDKCVDTISRQVGDIGRMVEEFSSFARMPKPEFEKYDLVGLVSNCVFSARLSKPDIDYELKSELPGIEVFGDQRLISQAVTNILKNAGEAVERAADDRDELSVVTTIRLADNEIEIDFEDSGPGFPAENRHRILEPYVTTREQGVGLGLAIVNRIIEDHGGRLSLLDRLDGKPGARVAVRLPLNGPAEDLANNWLSPEEHLQ